MNGVSLLKTTVTVFDDTSVDSLTGSMGQDWHFANKVAPGSMIDLVIGKVTNELIEEL